MFSHFFVGASASVSTSWFALLKLEIEMVKRKQRVWLGLERDLVLEECINKQNHPQSPYISKGSLVWR